MDSEFKCRDYHQDDFESVSKLWELTGVGNPLRGDDKTTINKTISMGGKFIILTDNKTSEIIGSSWITNDGRRLYLHHFAIHPKYQGLKLSHLLLKESFRFIKNVGLQVKLEVHKDNKVALNLYKNAGFKYLGDYHVYIIRNLNDIDLYL